jgi:hypothetical protein
VECGAQAAWRHQWPCLAAWRGHWLLINERAAATILAGVSIDESGCPCYNSAVLQDCKRPLVAVLVAQVVLLQHFNDLLVQ